MGKHNHEHCEHDLRYCKPCDAVYCVKCEAEWTPKPTYTFTYNQQSQPWVPLTTTHVNGSMATLDCGGQHGE